VTWARRLLTQLGAGTRQRVVFPLQVAALFWGVVAEVARPINWRRTSLALFRVTLTRIIAGALGTISVAAAIIGIGLVFQVVYWLRTVGQEESAGHILVTVLCREIAPLLVGVIILGRDGTAMVAELSALRAEGEIAVLRAEGIDIFQYLVLPRAAAFATGGFTLGFVFLLLTLLMGYAMASAIGIARASVFGFLANVLHAMSARDFAIVPADLVLIGLLIALSGCATALGAAEHERPTLLLPRAYTRGVTAILLVTIVLSTGL
jgi:phospholipid/cholesterol/gamma-HCH transport system permease protein